MPRTTEPCVPVAVSLIIRHVDLFKKKRSEGLGSVWWNLFLSLSFGLCLSSKEIILRHRAEIDCVAEGICSHIKLSGSWRLWSVLEGRRRGGWWGWVPVMQTVVNDKYNYSLEKVSLKNNDKGDTISSCGGKQQTNKQKVSAVWGWHEEMDSIKNIWACVVTLGG